MARKFFRTLISVEVLSEDAPISDETSLEEISYLISEGDCSGALEIVGRESLSGSEAAQALISQGSDPEFFRLDRDGRELSC